MAGQPERSPSRSAPWRQGDARAGGTRAWRLPRKRAATQQPVGRIDRRSPQTAERMDSFRSLGASRPPEAVPAERRRALRLSSPGPRAGQRGRLVGRARGDAARRDDRRRSELMLDPQRGRIAYVVVAHGGFMGIGERLHAIPWRALRIDGECLVLDAERATFLDAPGFDKEHWPRTTRRGLAPCTAPALRPAAGTLLAGMKERPMAMTRWLTLAAFAAAGYAVVPSHGATRTRPRRGPRRSICRPGKARAAPSPSAAAASPPPSRRRATTCAAAPRRRRLEEVPIRRVLIESGVPSVMPGRDPASSVSGTGHKATSPAHCASADSGSSAAWSRRRARTPRR